MDNYNTVIIVFLIILVYLKFNKPREKFNNDITNKLTIGIKTFCRPKCLDECLMNITKYYKNINILIADDSTNELKKQNKVIINKYKQINKNIKLIDLPFDTGLSKGRNILVNNCKTKYYLTLDESRFITNKTQIEKMVYFLEETNYDLIAGVVDDKLNRRSWTDGLFDEINDNSEPIIINVKKVNKKINNNYLEEVYDTNLTLNIFIAKTDKLKQSPWDNRLKIGEHETFFYYWFKNKNTCAICKNCYFGEVDKAKREYPKKFKYYRNRAESNNVFDYQKNVKLLF